MTQGMNVGSIFAKLDLDHGSFIAGMGAATTAVTTFQKATGRTNLLLSNLGLAFSAVGIGHMASEMIMAGEEMTSLQRKMHVLAESINRTTKSLANNENATQSAAETIEYLRSTALRTGSSFEALSKSYVQLVPVAASTGIAVNEVREAIEGTIGAGQLMGASNDEMGRAFVAIRQVVGKNALQMEELRGQLGEALPNSMLIMADGLSKLAKGSEEVRRQLGLTEGQTDVTIAKLNRLITDGVIDGSMFIKAWRLGTAEFRRFSEVAQTTVSGQFNNTGTIARNNIGGFMRDSGINMMSAAMIAEFNKFFDEATTTTEIKAKAIGMSLYENTREGILIVAREWDEAFVVNATIFKTALEGIRLVGVGFGTLLDLLPGWAIELGIFGYLLFGRGGSNLAKYAGRIAIAAIGIVGAVKEALTTMEGDMIPDYNRDAYDAVNRRSGASISAYGKGKGLDNKTIEFLNGASSPEDLMKRADTQRQATLSAWITNQEKQGKKVGEAQAYNDPAVRSQLEALNGIISAAGDTIRHGSNVLSPGERLSKRLEETIGTIKTDEPPAGGKAVDRVSNAFDALSGKLDTFIEVSGETAASNINVTKAMQEVKGFDKMTPAQQANLLKMITSGELREKGGTNMTAPVVKAMADFSSNLRTFVGGNTLEESRKNLSPGEFSKTHIATLMRENPQLNVAQAFGGKFLEAAEKLAALPQSQMPGKMEADYATRRQLLIQLEEDAGQFSKETARQVAEYRGQLEEKHNLNRRAHDRSAQSEAESALTKQMKMAQANAEMMDRARQLYVARLSDDKAEMLRIAAEEQQKIAKKEMDPSKALTGLDNSKLAEYSALSAVNGLVKSRYNIELQILDHKNEAFRLATKDLEIQNMKLQAVQSELSAKIMLTDEWRKQRYETEMQADSAQLSQLFYEYNLTAEQRLMTTRTQNIRAFENIMTTGFMNIMSGQESIGEGFRKMFLNAARYAAEFFLKMQIQQAMLWGMKALGFDVGGGGMTGKNNDAGIGGTKTGVITHTGGMAGEGGIFSKSLPASIWENAPRFHGGGLLRSDEVPIVAQRGEGIFTPDQMDNADNLYHSLANDNLSRGQNVNQSVTVNVNGGGGSPDQNKDLAAKIGKTVKSELRALVAEEMRVQSRPGGMMYGR